jgi:hypothetical protein
MSMQALETFESIVPWLYTHLQVGGEYSFKEGQAHRPRCNHMHRDSEKKCAVAIESLLLVESVTTSRGR